MEGSRASGKFKNGLGNKSTCLENVGGAKEIRPSPGSGSASRQFTANSRVKTLPGLRTRLSAKGKSLPFGIINTFTSN